MDKIDVCFVKNKWNYYSLATLFAAIEDMDYANPFFLSLEDLAKKTFSENTIFCFSLNSIYYKLNKENIRSALLKLKERGRYLFIAGGPHCQGHPSQLLEDGFDSVVIGSGEISIRNIIGSIKEKRPPSRIYKCEIDNLDDFKPFPIKYFQYKPIEITRGCPHKCYFCQTSYLLGDRPLHRSIQNIIKYIEIAFNRNIKDFRFISPNALSYGTTQSSSNLGALEELLSGIRGVIKSNGRIFFGSFPSEVRPEFVTAEAIEILKRYVDNKRLIMGAQSTSDRMLKLSHRGHSKEDVKRAIDISLEYGFIVDVDLIVGMPEEEKEDLMETIDFINQYINKSVRFHLHYFMPLPATPWQNKMPKEIPSFFLDKIKHLTGIGKVWGSWMHQKEVLAAGNNDY